METTMKSHDYIYKKILRDVKKYTSKNNNKNRFYYTDENGEETEAIFDLTPTKDEIEGLLIYLNKEKIPQA